MEVRLKYDFANLWNRLDIYFFFSFLLFQYFISRCALLSAADPNRCFTFDNVLGSSLNLVKVSHFISIYAADEEFMYECVVNENAIQSNDNEPLRQTARLNTECT